MRLDQFMANIQKIETAKQAFIKMADEDISREHAIVLLINSQKLTHGAAADTIAMCEALTGRKLRD